MKIIRIGAVSLLLAICFCSSGYARSTLFPQVEMVKKAMPSVVGIGIDTRGMASYRFSDSEQLDELKKFFKQEEKEFKKKGKPRWEEEKENLTVEDITVIGSGFIVDKKGTVVTANHVVEGQRRVYVVMSDNSIYKARVVRSSQADDVAIVEVEGATSEFSPIPLGNSDSLEIAEPVIAIGNPFGFTFTVTGGMVSALNRSLDSGTSGLIQTDAPLNPGNSGGPIINLNGEAVGVSHAIISPARQGEKSFTGLAFAVPINRAKVLLTATPDGGRAYLGLQVNQDAEGLRIIRVEGDGPAEAAGLEIDDILLSADGVMLSSTESLLNMVKGKKPGQTIRLEIERSGRKAMKTIILGSFSKS